MKPDDIPIEIWVLILDVDWLTKQLNKLMSARRLFNDWRKSNCLNQKIKYDKKKRTIAPFYKNKGDIQNLCKL